MPGTHRQECALWVLVGQLNERRVEAPAGDAPGHKVVCNDQRVPRYGFQKILGCPNAKEVVRERTLIPATTKETDHLHAGWWEKSQRKLGQKKSVFAPWSVFAGRSDAAPTLLQKSRATPWG